MLDGRAGRSASFAGDLADEGLEAEAVALGAEPRDHADGDRGDIGVLPEALAREDVREMYLDDRQPARDQRIAQRDARVRRIRPG